MRREFSGHVSFEHRLTQFRLIKSNQVFPKRKASEYCDRKDLYLQIQARSEESTHKRTRYYL